MRRDVLFFIPALSQYFFHEHPDIFSVQFFLPFRLRNSQPSSVFFHKFVMSHFYICTHLFCQCSVHRYESLLAPPLPPVTFIISRFISTSRTFSPPTSSLIRMPVEYNVSKITLSRKPRVDVSSGGVDMSFSTSSKFRKTGSLSHLEGFEIKPTGWSLLSSP